ncbi:type 1 glutamine amidotransferase domain-containing protein [Pseudoduganella namucuonensis]|uniref:Putative intracellular protease/amidase n=1 Tax=Pseudoduganella namucuonensis TaxID=1035707 RepID=A0A1I7KVU3_9BURK|nr:type 1 glutamine amidotransferase domain-containing protein [Pseudoduganella namucuonensis]SFV01414.1 Putative intracellular protease/amidase [Pseudoduganella namucuonensis]
MLKKTLRAAAWLAAILAVLAICAYLYARGFGLDAATPADPLATPEGLAYLKNSVPAKRGRVLAVVSSAPRFPGTQKKAGYELTELSRAYYVFQANGYEVDIASPAGGQPAARIDDDDMRDVDYAFLNDAAARRKLADTLPLARVDPSNYAAVYFVGGKGAMFDFPGNADINRIARAVAERGVVGAVCHGPAALLDVTLANGRPLVAGKRMTGFSNDEELFLMKDARARFPFLLEDRARERGARFEAGPKFVDTTVVDGRLVTGQNPWSTWSVAEAMVAALGHRPVARERTPEEHSVRMLAAYYQGGLSAARAERVARFDPSLVLLHALVAAMQWRVADAFQLQRLARG